MESSPIKGILYSIGTSVPPYKISQELHHSILESANGHTRSERLLLRKVYNNSGIDSRHSVLEEFGKEDHVENVIFHPAGNSGLISVSRRMELFETFAIGLCVDAVNDCVKHKKSVLKNVSHLITFSCTGMSAPGIDVQLVEELGLPRSTERTCINFMGCYAGINALKMANYIVSAQSDAVVLLVGVELCTLHYQKSLSQDQLVANAIFADGAAAAIVTSSVNGIIDSAQTFGLEKFYSEFEPAGKDEMAWRIGDNGFDIRLSSYVPDLIQENIASLLHKLFTHAHITQKDISWFAFHPGGVKILQACEKAIGISQEENKFSYQVLKEFGNMSSVTIFFVLKKYFESITTEDKGKKILSCAFGPGLTMESMILNVR
jgi:predicted naringenin-chalcone synthase